MIVDIKGFEGLYSISDKGYIYSHRLRSKPGKPYNIDESMLTKLKSRVGARGYFLHSLITAEGKVKTFYLHRLLAIAFIPNPNNYDYINHKNAIKLDVRLENLEWCTSAQNFAHAVSLGLVTKCGEDNALSKLTNVDRIFILANHLNGFKQVTLARLFKITPGTIRYLLKRYLVRYKEFLKDPNQTKFAFGLLR